MANVLVTGASRGVGREMTLQMAARGDRVWAASRSGVDCGAGTTALTLDVTDEASLAALEQALDGAALDLLVCNAGVFSGRGGVDDPSYTMAGAAEQLAVNVTGVFFTIRAAMPAIRRGGGRIAVISSQMGSSARGKGDGYLYRASKAAATNLAVCLSKELGEEGIAVGAYHPGWVRTDMGGAGADISAGESAAGLIQRFDALGMANTGCFEFYSGEAIPF